MLVHESLLIDAQNHVAEIERQLVIIRRQWIRVAWGVFFLGIGLTLFVGSVAVHVLARSVCP